MASLRLEQRLPLRDANVNSTVKQTVLRYHMHTSHPSGLCDGNRGCNNKSKDAEVRSSKATMIRAIMPLPYKRTNVQHHTYTLNKR